MDNKANILEAEYTNDNIYDHAGIEKYNTIDKLEAYFNRTEINEEDLAKKYTYQPFKSESLVTGAKRYLSKHYKPSLFCLKTFSLARLPIIDWLLKYDVKGDLAKDIVAGITIGIIQIPQGMAYSLMAGLPPIVGLYVTFFSVLVYAILGTSKHLSLGVYAIISLMVKATVESLEGKLYPGPHETGHLSHGLANATHSNYISTDPIQAKIMIGSAIAFYTGIIHVVFAILHVGFVTKYLSDVIVAAFTTGAAYHIVVSQIPILLGLKVEHSELPFVIIAELIEIFTEIGHTNFATLIISVVSGVFLYCVKHFINEKYKDKMPVPIPVDLIVIVTGTALSYSYKFSERYKVKVVGNIPLGLPTPTIPPLHLFSEVFGSSISIAIVSYAMNFSMAKLFAKKYKYQLDSNQEAFAYGAGNIVTCFFGGFPSCVGLSRMVILDSVGGKTQLYAIISTVLVIIVIEAIGPLFETLPTCCLGAIIVVALIGLIMEVKQLVIIYRRSKFESLAWLATFLGVFILDVDVGLYIGLIFSVLLVIVQSQRALTSVMGNIPYTDFYESIDICEEAKEFDGIKIIRYEASIYYANVEYFIYKIKKLSQINIIETLDKINKVKGEQNKVLRKMNAGNGCMAKCKNFFTRKSNKTWNSDEPNNDIQVQHEKEMSDLTAKIDEIKASVPVKDIIIDLSCVNLIDSMGVGALAQLNDLFKEIGVELHLTYCKRCIFRAFTKNKFKESFNYENIYPTTHDAVLSILRKNGTRSIRLVSKNKSSIHINLAAEAGNDSKGDSSALEGIEPKYVLNRRTPNVFNDITMQFDSKSYEEVLEIRL